MGRIREILDKIEAGEAVDFERIARLQPLEIAAAAEDFREEAIQRSREADEMMKEILDGFAE